MSDLWTPQSRDLQEKTREFVAEIAANARRDAICDYWDRELQKIDPKLMLLKAHDNAEAVGLKPGYWHVVRDCSPGPPSILPITGPRGEFVEPNDAILDLLRAGDLQNERAMDARRKQDEESARRRLRDDERAHGERVEEMMDRWRAAAGTSVSMSDAQKWSNKTAGRRGAKG